MRKAKDGIRAGLIARGVPADTIRFVHEATTPKAREAILAECRNGSCAILLGSTPKAGIGNNIQHRFHSLHQGGRSWTSAAWELSILELSVVFLNGLSSVCRFGHRSEISELTCGRPGGGAKSELRLSSGRSVGADVVGGPVRNRPASSSVPIVVFHRLVTRVRSGGAPIVRCGNVCMEA